MSQWLNIPAPSVPMRIIRQCVVLKNSSASAGDGRHCFTQSFSRENKRGISGMVSISLRHSEPITFHWIYEPSVLIEAGYVPVGDSSSANALENRSMYGRADSKSML